MESSYSTLDVTLQGSLLRHCTLPPGPARTSLDNYYSELTTDVPEALILHQLSFSLCSLSSAKFHTCKCLVFRFADSEKEPVASAAVCV